MIKTTNKNLQNLSLGLAVFFFSIGGIQQYLTSYFDANGFFGIGFTALIIAYSTTLITSFFNASLLVRFEAKQIIIVSVLIYIISFILVFNGNLFVIYLSAVGIGIGTSFLWSAQNSFLVSISNKTDLGKNSGYFFALFSLGLATGILVLGILVDIIGYINAFYLYLFIAFSSIYFLLKIQTTNKPNHSKKHLSKPYNKSKTLISLALTTSFLPNITFALTFSLIPVHIQSISDNTSHIGLISGIYFIIMILLSKKTGALSDTVGREKMTLTGIFIAFIGLFFLHYATSSLYLVAIGVTILALSNSILLPISNAIQGDISTKENLASITGIYVMFKYIGTVGGLAIGLIYGIKGGYIISIFVFLFITLVTYKTLENLDKAKEKIISEQTC